MGKLWWLRGIYLETQQHGENSGPWWSGGRQDDGPTTMGPNSIRDSGTLIDHPSHTELSI